MEEQLTKVKLIYGEFFADIIEIMLNPFSTERPSFIELELKVMELTEEEASYSSQLVIQTTDKKWIHKTSSPE